MSISIKLIKSVLIYATETWTSTKTDERIYKGSFSLICSLRWAGHVMRMEDNEIIKKYYMKHRTGKK